MGCQKRDTDLCNFLEIAYSEKRGYAEKKRVNYYPFGLQHKGFNNVVTGSDHKYGFGGKEEQDELGLDWIDISARNYDAALGRWMNLDPLAEQMRRHSPYNYAFDNPIYWTDPDGMMPCPPGEECDETEQKESDETTETSTDNPPTHDEGQTGRRRPRQRGSNRSRVGSGSLVFDARGQELLSHWLDGSGEDLVLNSENWQDYMREHEELEHEIMWEIGTVVHDNKSNNRKLKSTGTLDFDITYHGELEDNGYFTGYQMLHGTNSRVGDLNVKGTINYDSETEKYSYIYTATWNDIMDPNAQYTGDTLSASILKTFYSPQNYNVSISWTVEGGY